MSRGLWRPALVLGLAGAVAAYYLHGKNAGKEAPGSEPASRAAQAPQSTLSPRGARSPEPAGQARAPASGGKPSQTLEEYLKTHYPGSWTVVHDSSGGVQSVMGGAIPLAENSAQGALKAGRELGRYLGADPENLVLDPNRAPAGTEDLMAYHLVQKSQDFEVFGSGMLLNVRKRDGSVIIVTNELRPVDRVDPVPSVNAAEAGKIVLAQYAARTPELQLANERPVIWAESPPHELAWIFWVEVDQRKPTYNKYEVIVGAASSRILRARSVLVR